ncbi:MAG: glycosyltransferase [Hungatella sp.]|nr:glycosyltransferase [Hungatella sp.]
MSKSKVRISQCMIVKNEEKNIERALSWGRPVMWEQIVVDTGSTDRTAEIARQMGAKVYEFPWNDDFAAAKNYAIERCKGDWIAMLDADEYMQPEDRDKLPELMAQADQRQLDVLSADLQQVREDGTSFSSSTLVRFFRNVPELRYRRRIHEQLEAVTGRELRWGDAVAELAVFHTGYQKAVLKDKKKNERNKKLILAELKDHPDDHEMMGYMGDEYLSDEDRVKAAVWYGRAVEHMPERLGNYDSRSAATLANYLMILTESEDLGWRELYETAVEKMPMEADFDYIAGRFFASQGQADQAVSHLEAALEKLETYGRNNRAMCLTRDLLGTYDLLVRCCYEAGQLEKSMSYGVTYLKYDRYNMAVLSRMLKVLLPDGGRRAGENQAVLEFFSKLYDFSGLKDRLFLVKTARMSDCGGFGDYGADHLFTPEERALLRV